MTNPWDDPHAYGLLPLTILAEEVDAGFSMVAAWHTPLGKLYLAHDGAGEDGHVPFAFHGFGGLEEVTDLDEALAFVESCGISQDSRYYAFVDVLRRYFDGE